MEVHKRNIEQIFDLTTQLEASLFQRPSHHKIIVSLPAVSV